MDCGSWSSIARRSSSGLSRDQITKSLSPDHQRPWNGGQKATAHDGPRDRMRGAGACGMPNGVCALPIAPVLLLDLFDFFLAQPEVVAELVDDRLGHALADIFLVFARLFDGQLVDRDSVRQRVSVVRVALGQRRALIEAEQRVVGSISRSSSNSCDGSSSTTTATFFMASRKRRGIPRSASSTRA